MSRAVQTIFKRLYDDGLIYRAERLVNWSPALRSGLSDIEVDHREVEGELVSIRYGSLDSDDALVVATTRVETMLGDTAVAVHPEDERYTHLVGTEIELPLTGRMIPAREAEAWGLVTRVVPDEQCFEEALRLAHEIAQMPPIAVQLAKAAVLQAYETPLSAGLEHERRLFYSLFATEDQKEGMRAFLEKRAPQWRGR